MSIDTEELLAHRLGEYAAQTRLPEILVVFHGGEPLLFGPKRLTELARRIRAAIPSTTQVSFSVQTNGLLLSTQAIHDLLSAGFGISLSLDGPAEAQDRHRRTLGGRSSFERAERALARLSLTPAAFTGVISVIDPAIGPGQLFEFFSNYQIPRLDFLLPDAHHERRPPGRDVTPNLYVDWLLQAFDLWFDQYSAIPVRTFDQLLASVAGLPSETDAFGLGDVSLLCIETDGSYHDLDVLKITRPNATNLGASLSQMPIAEVASSQPIQAHRELLTKSGLSPVCQACDVVDVCGGGSVPHRFSSAGLRNPTVYCDEMYALIHHAKNRLEMTLRNHGGPDGQTLTEEMRAFEQPALAGPIVDALLARWQTEASDELRSVLSKLDLGADLSQSRDRLLSPEAASELRRISILPTTVLWTKLAKETMSGKVVRNLSGAPIEFSAEFVRSLSARLQTPLERRPALHRNDPWLRAPFGHPITFEDESVASPGRTVAGAALALIEEWSPAVRGELDRLCPDIQFIRDVSAHPDKSVSFSDDVVPGALYVAIRAGGELLDPYDLADSIIHEYRHQRLYLLQRSRPLVRLDQPLVPSPWREEPRPPSGLLHAVFVFVELRRFWLHVLQAGPEHLRNKAEALLETNDARLAQARKTLRETRLTTVGEALVGVLYDSLATA